MTDRAKEILAKALLSHTVKLKVRHKKLSNSEWAIGTVCNKYASGGTCAMFVPDDNSYYWNIVMSSSDTYDMELIGYYDSEPYRVHTPKEGEQVVIIEFETFVEVNQKF